MKLNFFFQKRCKITINKVRVKNKTDYFCILLKKQIKSASITTVHFHPK